MGYYNQDTQREYQRERLARLRANYFKDKVCFVCGVPAYTVVYGGGVDKRVWHKNEATRLWLLDSRPPACPFHNRPLSSW